MAKDYTKYSIKDSEGIVANELGKGRLVEAVIANFIVRFRNPTYDFLKDEWPDNVQGSKGVIRLLNEIDSKNERNYYINSPITLKDGTKIVVCNQWGAGNFSNFIRQAKTQDYEIITDGNDGEKENNKFIEVNSDQKIDNDSLNDEWNIIHDIATFYLFFGNLAINAAQKKEWNIISENLKKWKFGIKIEGVSKNFEIKNNEHFEILVNEVYDALYIEDNEPQKDPFEQLNNSHINLVNYFNSGVLNCEHIKTFLFNIYEICNIDSITPQQEHQLKWYVNQYKTVCPKVESIEHLIEMSTNQSNLKSEFDSLGIDTDLLDDLFNT